MRVRRVRRDTWFPLVGMTMLRFSRFAECDFRDGISPCQRPIRSGGRPNVPERNDQGETNVSYSVRCAERFDACANLLALALAAACACARLRRMRFAGAGDGTEAPERRLLQWVQRLC